MRSRGATAITAIDRYLNIRSAWGPAFSAETPDVLFLMNTTGLPLAWTAPRRGGWADPLWLSDERVLSVAAAPTGPWVVLSTDQAGNEREQLWGLRLDTREIRRLTAQADAIHAFGDFFSDGMHIAYAANGRNGRDFDIYLATVDGSEPPKRVLERSGSWRVAQVTPHDDALLLVESVSNLEQVLYLWWWETGRLERLTPPEPARWLMPTVTPDGRLLALSDWHADYLRLLVIQGDPRRPTVLVEEPWDLEALAVSPDGQSVAYSVNRAGWSALHLRDLATGRDREVDGIPPGVVGEFRFSPDGLWLAFSHTGPRHPLNVWTVGVVDDEPAFPVTRAHTAGFTPDDFTMPRLVECPTFDGGTVPAWFYEAAGSGARPAVVSVHGGPEAQERPVFNPVYQYWLAEGFHVLAPNVRGSTGYGRAYTDADNGPRRIDAVRDLEAVAGWLRRAPGVAGDRLAIYGGSYGGYMVLMAVTHLPTTFQAAVDIVGIANLETFLTHTGPWRRALREAEYGSLEDRELLRRLSPIHRVDAIVTPIMVVHGQNDPRVPVEESEQIVQALRERGRTVEYLVFPDEGHGVVRQENRRRLYPAIARFLKRAWDLTDG
jgi:dipeptidyl aminopeptidase/acylaminoacyl peptidase